MREELIKNPEASSASQQHAKVEATGHSPFDVAIIGLSGRFPKAENADVLWKNLCEGVEGVSFFSDEELLACGATPESLKQPNYVKAGGILDGVDLFDPEFFGFTPRDAAMLDPQHRLFLECAWEALEVAGYVPNFYPGRIAVFAGCALSDYLHHTGARDLDPAQAILATDKDFLPTRVSYKLNLRGPSIAVQTACSTSLVAVHLAWQSLLAGSCDMALAGAASIQLLEKTGYWHWEGGITSPDGRCRAFDAQAAGTVFGDGAGVVVLKRLSDAIRDGDCIRAIITGSAMNNDGALKVGYTAPSVEGQAAVISQALAVAGISPEAISYVEAHGTGTALGDPVEIAALTRAYSALTSKKQFCAVGSVKTSVGHLNVAAGITGLITAVLALEHRQLPRTLHFEQPNSNIDFQNSPFYVNAALTNWEGAKPLHAAVSSFGIGGTNAHVILQEAPFASADNDQEPPYVLPFSARTPAVLQKMPARLSQHLRSHPELNPADVAYTLQAGRQAFTHRRVLVCRRPEEMLQLLESPEPLPAFPSPRLACRRSIAFMFPGQGTQHPNMARDLYLNAPAFRQQVDACAERLKGHLGRDIRDLLYDNGEAAAQHLDATWITQPALFVTEYALACQWMALGVRPNAMIGHSIGEYVAACLAGVFTLEDALALVAARGRLMQSLPRGYMLAVYCNEAEIGPLPAGVCIAAVNSPSSCVLSGRPGAMDSFSLKLVERGIDFRRLQTSHAFHSEMMDSIVEPFAQEVRNIRLQAPRIPYVSNVTGDFITPELCTDPDYWCRHLRQAVIFSAGIERIFHGADHLLLVEVGAGRSLSALVAQHGDASQNAVLLSSLRDSGGQINEYEAFLRALGHAWAEGVDVDWRALHAGKERRRVPLPSYPFEHVRCWLGASSSGRETAAAAADTGTPARPPESTQPQDAAREMAAAPTAVRALLSPPEELVSGPVPLTPIQQWFFQQDFIQPEHWNMSVLLEVDPAVSASVMNEALPSLLRHHDALRLRFTRVGNEWRQVNAARLHDVLTTVSVPHQAGSEVIQQQAAEVQSSLNLSTGPLFRAVQVTRGEGHPSHLLLVCHHLAVDITSWRILIEDLNTACMQLQQGKPIELPRKTTSFQTWAQRLALYRSSSVVQEQMQKWLSRFDHQAFSRLASSCIPDSNTVDSARTVAASLPAEETGALTRDMARAHGARVSEVVLAGVAESLGRWTNSAAVLIDVESHGRQSTFAEDVDLSRTVGWFTGIFPVIVNVQSAGRSAAALEQVKEQMRWAADNGTGYGLLRCGQFPSGTPAPLAVPPQAQVSFNFLGNESHESIGESLFHLRSTALGSEQAPKNHRPYLIEVNSWISEGRLHLSFGYSRHVFRRADITQLSAECMNILRAMIVEARHDRPEVRNRLGQVEPLTGKDNHRVKIKSGTRQHPLPRS
jgi:phthiocerol/phenolphthiocerol synthesis type-I polyketide synthase E